MKKRKRRKIDKTSADYLLGEHFSARARESAKVLRDGAQELDILRSINKKCSTDQLGGRCAEVHHKVTRNLDAAKQGIKSRTRLTKPGSAADLKNRTRLSQVKYHKTATISAGRAADKKYTGMELILPADQADAAAEVLKRGAKRMANKNPKKATLRADAAKRIRKTHSAGGAQSRPLTKKGARELARKGGAAWRKEANLIEALGTSTAHLKAGAINSGVITGVEEVYKLLTSDHCPRKASINIAKSAASGGANSVTNHIVTVGVRKTAKKIGAKVLLKGNAAASIAGGVIDIAKHGYSYANGEMTSDDFLNEAGKSVAKAGATYAATEIAAMAGFAIGGPAGAFLFGSIASIAAGIGVEKLYED